MKTTLNKKDPHKFLEDVAHDKRRQDSLKVLKMMGDPNELISEIVTWMEQRYPGN